MQIVINVPEKLACEGFERPFTEEERNILIKAIGNGTPLPKGHGRIVDIGPYDGKVIASRKYCGVSKLVEVAELDTIIEADKESEI